MESQPKDALASTAADEQALGVSSLVLPIRFTGSGSEYFRIWIVNLLLTLLTLTLYTPFARARRLAYFYGNTLVGQDALGFHGDPWKMLRGYVLILCAAGITWAVSHLFPALAWLPLLLGALLWPWLWHASLRFRLGNTSWRGVRLAFVGDVKGAYLCMAPLAVFVLALTLLVLTAATAQNQRWMAIWQSVAFGALVLGFLVCLPWQAARLMRYMHSGYVFAQQQTQLDHGAGAFYRLSLKVCGVFLACAVLPAGAVLAMVVMWDLDGTSLVTSFFTIGYLFIPLILNPYAVSRRQNLVWSNTRSQRIRFDSHLRFGALFRLNAANWLLIALTLGLYWPFAQVRTARLRLESVILHVDGSMDQWTAKQRAMGQGTLGEGAVDFLGVDVGF